MANSLLFWKVRGSHGPFRSLRTSLPASVCTLRQLLKEATGVSALPSLDVLLYSENQAESVLADSDVISEGAHLLVQRVRTEEALRMMEAANAVASQRSLRTTETTQTPQMLPSHELISEDTAPPTSSSTSIFSSFPAAAPPPTSLPGGETPAAFKDGRDAGEDEEEERRIHAMMQQHAEHRGPSNIQGDRESLGQRYYRTRNLRWTAEQANGIESGLPASLSSSTTATIPPASYGGGAPVRTRGTSHGYGMPTRPRGPPYSANFSATRPVAFIPVSPDYICHMCGEKGHHIKNCPKTQTHASSKKVKPATGIPANFLQKILPEEIALHSDVFLLKDGSFAIMKNVESVSARAYFSKTIEQRVQQRLGSSSVEDVPSSNPYKCALCQKLFDTPMLMPCCGETCCKKCVLQTRTPSTLSSPKTCPFCHARINLSELTLNKAVKECVEAIIGGDARDMRPLAHEKGTASASSTTTNASYGLNGKRARETAMRSMENAKTTRNEHAPFREKKHPLESDGNVLPSMKMDPQWSHKRVKAEHG